MFFFVTGRPKKIISRLDYKGLYVLASFPHLFTFNLKKMKMSQGKEGFQNVTVFSLQKLKPNHYLLGEFKYLPFDKIVRTFLKLKCHHNYGDIFFLNLYSEASIKDQFKKSIKSRLTVEQVSGYFSEKFGLIFFSRYIRARVN